MIKIVLLALIGIIGVSCKTATKDECEPPKEDSVEVPMDSSALKKNDTTKDGAGSFKTLPDSIE